MRIFIGSVLFVILLVVNTVYGSCFVEEYTFYRAKLERSEARETALNVCKISLDDSNCIQEEYQYYRNLYSREEAINLAKTSCTDTGLPIITHFSGMIPQSEQAKILKEKLGCNKNQSIAVFNEIDKLASNIMNGLQKIISPQTRKNVKDQEIQKILVHYLTPDAKICTTLNVNNNLINDCYNVNYFLRNLSSLRTRARFATAQLAYPPEAVTHNFRLEDGICIGMCQVTQSFSVDDGSYSDANFTQFQIRFNIVNHTNCGYVKNSIKMKIVPVVLTTELQSALLDSNIFIE